jgi:ABC-2 type transport system permease protein
MVAAIGAVYAGQIARARVARVPLLFVAAFQSIGILLLLRGVVARHDDLTGRQVVSGAVVLVAGFVCLNLLAQRIGALRAEGGLDHYAALDVPGPAVALGAAGSYATLTIPGAVITAVVGCALFDLPYGRLWILVLVLPLAGASLAGVGALIGMLAPRQELATVAGQLGMSAVLFLGLIPEHRLPLVVQWLRAVVPSTYAVDALAATFVHRVDWTGVIVDLLVCLAVAIVSLGAAGLVFRRSVR